MAGQGTVSSGPVDDLHNAARVRSAADLLDDLVHAARVRSACDMSPFPRLADPLTDGQVVLRDYAERDIPEILIAYQDDPRLHQRLGQNRPPSGAELGS